MRQHMINLPDQNFLRDVFDYDPETGVLRWKVRPEAHFAGGRCAAEKLAKTWNLEFSGSVAGCGSGNGYIKVGLNGRLFFAHRLIYKMVHGTDPRFVDHIDGDTSNNRIENLRSVDRSDNQKNQKRRRDNGSGVCGVYWDSSRQKWTAQISIDGRARYLGRFSSFADAVSARKTAQSGGGYHQNHGRAS